jgi:tetratricopeptide (TPR) repeat protein
MAVCGLLLLAIALAAAYANSFQGALLYDDQFAIVDNLSIRHLDRIGQVLSPPRHGETVTGRPVLNLSFAVNYAFGGLDVRGYHAVNLAIHVLGAWLLFGILRRTLAMPAWHGRFEHAGTPLALAIAGLWALHPLQTESVTYIVQRAESLASMFSLLTLYSVLRGAMSRRAWPWYAMAVAACWAGIGTKEVAVGTPLLVLLYDWAFLAGSFAEALRRRWPLYAGLAAGWALSAWLVLSSGAIQIDTKVAPDAWAYARSQPGVILHYLRLCLWPQPLCLVYEWPVAETWGEILPGTIAIGALGAVGLWALWRWPAWGFWGAWFFVCLAPTSSILPLGQLAFEHRMYLALAPVVVVVLLAGYWGWEAAAERLRLGRPMKWMIPACLLVVAGLLLGVQTYRRNCDYRSEASIWEDTLRKTPHSALAHNNLGAVMAGSDRTAEAIDHYQQALRINPNYADAHNNLGDALASSGRTAEAIEQYQQALRIDPDYAKVHNNLGNALVSSGRVAEAIEHYWHVVRISPGDADAHHNLGNTLASAGRISEAIEQYQQALHINPNYTDAHYNLGAALAKSGRIDEAIEQYQQALRINPDHARAHNNLGNALAGSGRVAEAIEHYRHAVRISPGDGDAHNNLANALVLSGRISQAIEQYQEALRINPDNATVHTNLGNALRKSDRIPEAIEQYRQALRINPDFAEPHHDLGIALARSGRIPEAIEHLECALRLAEAAGQKPLAQAVRARLQLLRSGRP